MTALKVFFWICLFLVCYTYFGYGLLLWMLVQLKRIVKGRTAKAVLPADDELPHVTLMICAYNEQDVVDIKMENTRQLDYPKDKLHVMWVTDGTTDDTNERLAAYPDAEIVYTPERKGKTAALNHGIAGEKRVKARHEGQNAAEGEGLYWRYESTLKRLDSELYSAMGAAGELNAIRTELYEPMPETALLDDFVMSMRLVGQGYRIAYAPDAYAMEYGSANLEEESKRKRRIAAGGLQSVWWLRHMMIGMSHSSHPDHLSKRLVVAFQFVSHRVLRWSITPIALLALIPLNITLVAMNAGSLYTIILVLQILFYLSAVCGWWFDKTNKSNKLFYACYYFLFMNINVFRGMHYLKTHQGGGTWEKAKRA